jgi:hypothetical protein
VSDPLNLIGSRELAARLRPLRLSPAAFARLDDAPKPVLRIGIRGLRWSRGAVDFWISERLEAARREAARQALEVLG